MEPESNLVIPEAFYPSVLRLPVLIITQFGIHFHLWSTRDARHSWEDYCSY